MTDRKTRCYTYVRVSTEMQVDGYSLDAQKDRLVKYAQYQNMEIVREYCDAGKSGKSITGRPEFAQMLKDIEEERDKVDFILVFKLSRFGRNAADVLNSLQVLQDYGVNLVCIEDGIDSSKESGKLTITVLSAVAEIERENILVQTMEGRKQKAREGKWNGGHAPFGYRLDSKKGVLVVDPEEAEVVKLIFDKYAHTSDGFDSIAIYLNQHGYQKNKKKDQDLSYFSQSYIGHILENPVYIGKIKYGENTFKKVKGTRDEFKRVKADDYIIVDGQHEAIIDEETWNAVQERRAKMATVNIRKHDHVYLLSGILKCPICGRGLVGTYSRKLLKKGGDSVVRYYYRCGHGKIAEDGSRCTYSPSWNEIQMNDEVFNVILDMTKNTDFREYILNKIGQKVDVSSLEEERERLRLQLKQTNGSKAKLISMIEGLDLKDRNYNRKYYDMQNRLDALYDKISEFENSIAAISQKIDGMLQKDFDAQKVFRILADFDSLYQKMSDTERKAFLSLLIDRIELDPNETDIHKCIKSINLMFPIANNADLESKKGLNNETTVECVVMMSRNK